MPTDFGQDQRTVFVQQLASRLCEHELKSFFSKAGKVRNVKIVTDRVTRRSRGFGYVEFFQESSVPIAIMMSGEKLAGIPIAVSRTESERNRLAAMATQRLAPDREYTILHVSNLHPEISDLDLRKLFEPFGKVESLTVSTASRSRAFATVCYRRHTDARRALSQLNGLELAGMAIQISPTSEKT